MKKGRRLKKTAYAIGGGAVVFILFMSIPRTLTTEWIGIPEVQDRIRSAQAAAYWYTRSRLVPREGRLMDKPQYGQMEGLTSDGRLVLRIADGAEWRQMALPFAGISLVDLYRSAIHVRALSGTSARFDIYDEPREESRYSVVVWVHQKPVNLGLVEEGVAKPEPKPVTSIMDIAYAHYYWQQALGAKRDVEGIDALSDEPSTQRTGEGAR